MLFNVTTMTCDHCVRTLTRALQALDPHARTEISLQEQTVRTTGAFTAEAAKAAIEAEGYKVGEVIETEAGQEPAPRSCCGTCHT